MIQVNIYQLALDAAAWRAERDRLLAEDAANNNDANFLALKQNRYDGHELLMRHTESV